MVNSDSSKQSGSEPATLAEDARQAREAAGLSIRQAAPLIGCHHSVLARIENGETTRPSPELLQNMATVYEVDAEQLLAHIGIKPTLPEPKVYFRKAYGIDVEPGEVEAIIAELRARKQSPPKA